MGEVRARSTVERADQGRAYRRAYPFDRARWTRLQVVLRDMQFEEELDYILVGEAKSVREIDTSRSVARWLGAGGPRRQRP